jgi:hypothetical protein
MFKVGDKVYSPLKGFGFVKEIRDVGDYPIRVKFSDAFFEIFTNDGKYYLGSPQPLLFHHEVEYVKVEPKFERGEWVRVSGVAGFPESTAVRFGEIEDGRMIDADGAVWYHWKKLDINEPLTK